MIDAFVAYNGRSSRGFGYVTFKNPPDAASALKAQAEGIKLHMGDEEADVCSSKSVAFAVLLSCSQPSLRESQPFRVQATPAFAP